MTDSNSPKPSGEVRAEPIWHVRVSPHTGIEPSQRNSASDAIVADVSIGGLRILTTVAFDPDDLIQVEMVRPSKKNPAVGHKVLAVARVRECRRLSPNGNGSNHRPRVNGKIISYQLRAQFLSLDDTARDWVKCVVEKEGRPCD